MIMLRCVLVACFLLLLSGPAGAFSTTLNPGSSDSTTLALADDGNQDISISQPDSLPFEGRDTASDPPLSARPGALADGVYKFSNNRFDIFFNDMLQSGDDESTSLLQGEILFSVDEEVAYDLSGFLQVFDDRDPGDVVLFVSLTDTTDDDVLFSQVLFSRDTSDQNFQLGVANGDTRNELLGSLTGSIAAGNVYELEYAAQIANGGDFAGGSSSGFGTVELRLIPEPTTALLLVAGLAGLAAQRRRAS